VKVNSRCCGSTNKDKLLKKAPTRENVQVTVSNRYSILEMDNIVEGYVTHSTVDNKVVKSNLRYRNQCINREEPKELKEVIMKTVWNSSEQQETQFIQGLPHRSQDTDGTRRFKIPTLINGSTSMIKNDTLLRIHKKNINMKNSTGARSNNSASKVQHKVFVLGDSHLRGSVVKIRSELSAKFEVTGVFKPGASAEKIVNTSADDLQNLHTQDVIVLNAGANDVYKNNKGVALTQITKFIQRNYGTNIIILDIPQRYDLSLSSCVNSEIEEFNRKLKRIVTSYNHASLLETNLKREFFTRHGLHWNKLGKALVVKLILLRINKLIGKGPQTPINLTWKDNSIECNIISCNEEYNFIRQCK
jgi:hypothetical protein